MIKNALFFYVERVGNFVRGHVPSYWHLIGSRTAAVSRHQLYPTHSFRISRSVFRVRLCPGC